MAGKKKRERRQRLEQLVTVAPAAQRVDEEGRPLCMQPHCDDLATVRVFADSGSPDFCDWHGGGWHTFGESDDDPDQADQ